MTRKFTLAGLLRLRHMQEDAAAQNLAAANRKVSAGARHEAAVFRDLEETPAEASTAAALAAMGAARAAASTSLAGLQAVAALDAEAQQAAQADFSAARQRSRGLEKLEEKHAEGLAAADLAAEQTAVDEIAAGSWHRDRTGAHA